MDGPRVLLATRRPPFPLDSGARIRTARLATGLVRHLPVTLVTFADAPTHDDTRASRADLESVLPDVEVELVAYGRGRSGDLRRNALRRGSADWSKYATPAFRDALRRQVQRHPGTVLHLDDPGVGLAALGLADTLSAFAPHNVEHRIVRDLARAAPMPGRVALELEWRKTAREERRLWRAADVCVAVSEVDGAAMSEAGARRVVVAPNGTDPVQPAPLQAPAGDEPMRLLFVGAGNFWPYELGLAWFVREVMPRVADVASFDVVGPPPLDPVPGPGVTYHGRVPEVAPYYAGAHALVIPIFQGSGTRLKAIEAAAMRRPVISTALGVEGLPLREREHYLRAEDAEQFAAAIQRLRSELAESPQAVEARMDAARAAVDGYFWPQITDELAALYRRLAEDSAPRR